MDRYVPNLGSPDGAGAGAFGIAGRRLDCRSPSRALLYAKGNRASRDKILTKSSYDSLHLAAWACTGLREQGTRRLLPAVRRSELRVAVHCADVVALQVHRAARRQPLCERLCRATWPPQRARHATPLRLRVVRWPPHVEPRLRVHLDHTVGGLGPLLGAGWSSGPLRLLKLVARMHHDVLTQRAGGGAVHRARRHVRVGGVAARAGAHEGVAAREDHHLDDRDEHAARRGAHRRALLLGTLRRRGCVAHHRDAVELAQRVHRALPHGRIVGGDEDHHAAAAAAAAAAGGRVRVAALGRGRALVERHCRGAAA
eukprot:scaffold51988_cov59-Phaeocystis_antarctica.AAC.3